MRVSWSVYYLAIGERRQRTDFESSGILMGMSTRVPMIQTLTSRDGGVGSASFRCQQSEPISWRYFTQSMILMD